MTALFVLSLIALSLVFLVTTTTIVKKPVDGVACVLALIVALALYGLPLITLCLMYHKL